MQLLLDTCALLWLASGDEKLSAETLNLIDDANSVYVSAITGFEVALKYTKGKLVLPKEPAQWFAEVLQFYHIEAMPLSIDASILSTQLPFHHQDPCDRFIIATAMLNELPIVTGDDMFKRYGVELLS